jgi:vacuolar protein sorting-associated protein 35
LNPHVNIKAIVIGLMDRLSSYAARESESESPEDRKKTEEEATLKLLEKLRIGKERKPENHAAENESKEVNGGQPNGEKLADLPESSAVKSPKEEPEPTVEASDDAVRPALLKKKRGIPDDVKLYEIFYDQVTNLVGAQRLHIHDTIALLVSLVNLALLVSPASIWYTRS